MAGLGETCTHVAAVLEAVNRVQGVKPPTQSQSSWIPPERTLVFWLVESQPFDWITPRPFSW